MIVTLHLRTDVPADLSHPLILFSCLSVLSLDVALEILWGDYSGELIHYHAEKEKKKKCGRRVSSYVRDKMEQWLSIIFFPTSTLKLNYTIAYHLCFRRLPTLSSGKFWSAHMMAET